MTTTQDWRVFQCQGHDICVATRLRCLRSLHSLILVNMPPGWLSELELPVLIADTRSRCDSRGCHVRRRECSRYSSGN